MNAEALLDLYARWLVARLSLAAEPGPGAKAERYKVEMRKAERDLRLRGLGR